MPRNRRLDVVASASVNGIDYVEVREAESYRAYVHFLNQVAVAAPSLVATVSEAGGEPVALAPVAAADWSIDLAGRPVLRLTPILAPSDAMHRVAIEGAPALDAHFAAVDFSFLAYCPSPVDCAPLPPDCPADEITHPPIDYRARDWNSIRRALSDYSAQRLPEWVERSPADLGVTVLEALAAIGDEFALLQDRIACEAAIGTARERRSIERLARLVDYQPRPLIAARAWLQFEVAPPTLKLAAGTQVEGQGRDGQFIPFALGAGIADTRAFEMRAAWNALTPYWWDQAERCLAPGATRLDLSGHGHGLSEGQPLIIETADPLGVVAARRTLVTIATPPIELIDPLYAIAVTRIEWDARQAPREWHDLEHSVVRANVAPAIQGARRQARFTIGAVPPGAPPALRGIERRAANWRADAERWYALMPLSGGRLGWSRHPQGFAPEITVTQVAPAAAAWEWRESLLTAGAAERVYAIEPGAWRRVARFANGDEAYDYDGSDGEAVRFGDATTGEALNTGDAFDVRWSVALGAAGNLAADSITRIDPALSASIVAVTNPFAADGGADAETDAQVRVRAPEAFRAITWRAVRTEDYDAAMARLPWVQRSGTRFRWTGSWPSVFATLDARETTEPDRDQLAEAVGLLNRVRLAGYEVFAPMPVRAPIDLEIVVCASADALAGDVHAEIDRRLAGRRPGGFFHPDRFTLGSPLDRSALEAAIEDAPGVAGVRSIRYRWRGRTPGFVELPARLRFPPGRIASIDNDPAEPGRGGYRLRVEGGR